MANETLIAKLEQNLRQSRATRTRLAARLAELESEADIVRGELIEMDTLAGQTEAAIVRLLSNVMTGPSTPVGTTSVGELEIEMQRRIARAELAQHPVAAQRQNVPKKAPGMNDAEVERDGLHFPANAGQHPGKGAVQSSHSERVHDGLSAQCVDEQLRPDQGIRLIDDAFGQRQVVIADAPHLAAD